MEIYFPIPSYKRHLLTFTLDTKHEIQIGAEYPPIEPRSVFTGLINDVHRFEIISTIPAVSTAVKFNPGGGLVAGNN